MEDEQGYPVPAASEEMGWGMNKRWKHILHSAGTCVELPPKSWIQKANLGVAVVAKQVKEWQGKLKKLQFRVDKSLREILSIPTSDKWMR